jgi:hypothetical protein
MALSTALRWVPARGAVPTAPQLFHLRAAFCAQGLPGQNWTDRIAMLSLLSRGFRELLALREKDHFRVARVLAGRVTGDQREVPTLRETGVT